MMRCSVGYPANKVPRCASETEIHRCAVVVAADRAAGKGDQIAGIQAALHGRPKPAHGCEAGLRRKVRRLPRTAASSDPPDCLDPGPLPVRLPAS